MEALGNESFPQEILFEVLDMSVIQIDQEEEFGVWRYKLKFTWHDHRLKWPKTCQNSQKEENQTNLHIITSNHLKYLWNPVAIVNTFGYQFGNYGEPEIDKTITLSKVKEKQIWVGKSQIKTKADLRAVDSPKKRMNEYDFFAVKSKKAKTKTNLFVRFLGESTVCQSAYGFI